MQKKTRRNIEFETAKRQLELLQRREAAKTIAERNAISRKIIDDLADIFISEQETPHSIIPKLKKAIKKDKFRPRNQSLIQFSLDPDLEYINGPFSTFTPGRKVTPETDRDALRTALSQSLTNIENVSQQYAEDVIYSLKCIPKKIIRSALEGDLSAYNTILTTIKKDLIKIRGLKQSLLTIEVLPDTDKDYNGRHIATPNKPHKIIILPNKIKISLNNTYKEFAQIPPSKQQQVIFIETLSVFVHEFGHFIDTAYPQHGALGAQTRHLGLELYDDSTEEKYLSNPTETSSFKIQPATRARVYQWLKRHKFKE